MLTCVLSAPKQAQTNSSSEKRTAIKELINLINSDNKAEELANVLVAQIQESEDAIVKDILKARTDLTATERKSIEDSLLNDKSNSAKRFQDKLMQKLNYSELVNQVVSVVYDRYYSLEDIKNLTAFYRTPTGQKSLQMMTPIASDTIQMMQAQLLPKIPIIIKELQDEDRLEIEQKINARKPKPNNGARK